ncbi:MAG TPA: hypothetical protein VNF68_02900 [Candidatus Baltobacteraceae bacterium]|nr:hypothetical protein [Candidatus Baltobacteraceae bacterium]
MRYETLFVSLGLAFAALRIAMTVRDALLQRPGKRSPLRWMIDRILTVKRNRHFRQQWQLANRFPERARALLCVPTGLEGADYHQAPATAIAGRERARKTQPAGVARAHAAHPLLDAAYGASAKQMQKLVDLACGQKPTDLTEEQWLDYLNGPVIERIVDIQQHRIDVAAWPHIEGEFEL